MDNLQHFSPEAEDILTDEDLLELFRIIKQIIRKKPDTERVAKLYFCIAYAMGDMYQFYKPKHSDHLIFKDDSNIIGDIALPASAACCCQTESSLPEIQQQQQQQQKQLSVSYLTNPSPQVIEETTTDQYSVRPYTHIRPIYPSTSQPQQQPTTAWSPPKQPNRYPHLNTLINSSEVLMEPKQRGFYYQDGRISREPALLQRYAEQGVLTQASLLRKRKKQFGDTEIPYELSTLPAPAKKPKIPHRHGEFKQRRNDHIIVCVCVYLIVCV